MRDITVRAELVQVSQKGQLLSRRGRRLPADASALAPHRDSITSFGDVVHAAGGADLDETLDFPYVSVF
eukprot:COSAG01_NODE_4892_length_4648_cov_3.866344_4_plen_69_part_00